jgi:dTDP-4-dehydrorhamnose 3,5-epimerase-like enzyme
MDLPTIADCTLHSLPKVSDPRGNLTFIENSRHVPFDIKRVFFLYDVPTAEGRGAHAHREQHQFMVCLAGSFDVLVDDGRQQETIHLNRPWQGLHIPEMIWAAELNFDPGSICLILSSHLYCEADYVRDYATFLRLRGVT